MKTQNAEVKRIARLAFPEYKGRKFSVETSGRSFRTENYWDGGTREYVKAVVLATGKVVEPSETSSNVYSPSAHGEVAAVPGVVIVTHHIFCGTDAGLTVHVHPSNVTPALSAGEVA